MIFKNRCLFSSLVLVAASAQAGASIKQTIDLDHSEGATEFYAIGRPSAIKIHGKGSPPRGTLTLTNNHLNGIATLDISSLDTGMQLRNEHMKNKYLEVKTYPEAKLNFKDVEVSPSAAAGKPFHGMLTLHGVTKPVEGTLVFNPSDTKASGSADFTVKLTDYGIAIPSFAGITVAEDVELHIQISAPLVTAQ